MQLKKIFHRRGKVGMKRRRSKVGSFFMFLGIFQLAAFMAFPLYYTVVQSLKPIDEIFRFPPTLYVNRPTLDNYGEMFRILANMWVPLWRPCAAERQIGLRGGKRGRKQSDPLRRPGRRRRDLRRTA